jgi:cytochrome c oxidase subunit 1
MYATMLIAVPTGVKVFNWVATMWRGSMTFETPMLWAVGFVILFTIGGFSGLMLAIVPSTSSTRTPTYVVAHFHYVLVAGSLFAMFAGGLLLEPEVDRRHVQREARQAPLLAVADLLQRLFFPMHFLGLAGMPRRYADYPLQFADFNALASVGAFGFGITQLLFFILVVVPVMRGRGEKAPQQPWEGAEGLEWEVPSPAPFHTFENPPKLDASATKVIG